MAYILDNIYIKNNNYPCLIFDGLRNYNEVKYAIEKFPKAFFIALTTSDYEKEKLEERLAKLLGGVAVIHIGAATESELKEKKARVDDALHATFAAVAEGIVPGGGVALLRALKSLDNLKLEGDEKVGLEIIRQAAYAPAIAIANNCGKQGSLIAEKIYEKEGSWGYNGLTDEFCDLIQAGVIDPVLVTKSALKSFRFLPN